MRFLLVLFFLNTLFLNTYCREVKLTHYSTKDGLSQNTVMCTIQDHNGTLWFATWNGINRFDGHGFIAYKMQSDTGMSPMNGRINWIGEDRYGYIWMLGYDYNVYRFSPRTESFEQVTAVVENSDIRAERVIILDNGNVWIVGVDGGALRVQPDSISGKVLHIDNSIQRLTQCGRKVNDVATDAAGEEWVLTDNGLVRYNKYNAPKVFLNDTSAGNSRHFHAWCKTDKAIFFSASNGEVYYKDNATGKFHIIKLQDNSDIIDIDILSSNELIACTENCGAFIYNITNHVSTRLKLTKGLANSDIHIKSVYIDRDGIAWLQVTEPHTVYWFNRKTMKLKKKTIVEEMGEGTSSNPSFHIHEDVLGRLWVHPYAGGFSFYDRANDSIVPFCNDRFVKGRHLSSKIHSAMSDNQGNLWLCTHSKGLEKISFVDSKFSVTKMVDCDYETLRNNVRAFCRDRFGRLWVGIRNGSIAVYDSTGKYIGYLTENGDIGDKGAPFKGVAYTIMQDKAGNIWVGTRGEGLVKMTWNGHRYEMEHFRRNENDPYSLSEDNVYALCEDKYGRIWVATFGGGIDYTEHRNGKTLFISHRNELKQFPIGYCRKVRHVATDSHGDIWLGTSCGAVRFSSQFRNPSEIVFNLYIHIPGDNRSLSNNEVHWIQPTSSGELYLLTFGGGLCRFDGYNDKGNARFTSIQTKDGLASDVLLSSQEDNKGNLWISSENGIIKYVPSTGYMRFFSDSEIGIDEVEFNEAASYRNTDGKLYFGSSNGGYVSFYPDSIKDSHFSPSIIFSQLSVMGEATTPTTKNSVLTNSIDYTQELRLPYDKNTFSISFAAQDMLGIETIKYRYRLDNIDDDWVNSGTSHSATYTDLSPGHYVLHVMSTNSDGVWCNNERTISIVVNPPMWRTVWAYMIYAVLIAIAAYIVIHIFYVIFRLRHEVDVEQKVAEAKLRFFTDISHELRTPLTLITGPLDCILEKDNLPEDVRGNLSLMKRNTDRMLRLVNQILDFRKIQGNKMKLCVRQIELVDFVTNIMKNFRAFAEEHKIDLVSHNEVSRVYVWADDDKLEKVFFNLLSNALKYTPDGKIVMLSIREYADNVTVEVADQGIGIPKERRSSLFVRFENRLNKRYFSQSSTGIGLSLTKEFVELHGGNIKVEDRQGGGTSFIVELPKGRRHFKDDTEYIVGDVCGSDIDSEVYLPDSMEEGNNDVNRHTILIVEDNREMSAFLSQMFVGEFTVYTASDGQEGAEKASDIQPDLIISDVMMPKMDGVEMVSHLRSDISTSHIPIILLTAKSDIDNRLKGLEVGADDYLTKPFSSSYLKARVDNILKRRIDICQFYKQGKDDIGGCGDKADAMCITQRDREFLDRLKTLIDKEMENSDLLIGDLASNMAVSRTVFFKKLKLLTGLSPNEFLREMRITKAAQLIDTNEYSISQISDMVGISSTHYFAKCFKQKFGMTATEYKNRNRN